MREDEIIAELLRQKIINQADYAQCAKEALAEGKPVVDILYEKGLVSAETLAELGWKVKRPKTVISGFEVIGEIKQGAMGTVYKAIQTSLGRPVALKVLPAWLARDATYVERFLREARAAAAINHPNIVSVIDVGVDNGIYYMVMEYVEGENLRDMINRRGRIPEKEALKYTLDIAQALEAAHRAGIVHRDIKPANILIAEDGTAKLCDLGLAKKREGDVQLTGVGQVLGSPQYMAPEQVEDSASVDIRSDIYSLGVTLFQMLTGRLPYEGRNIYEIMEKQLREPIPDVRRLVPGVSEATARLLRRMTEKRSERRYQTPSSLIKDIKRVMSGRLPKPAPAVPKARPAPRPEPRVEPARPAERRHIQTVQPAPTFPVGKVVAIAVVVIIVLVLISVVPRFSSTPTTKQPIPTTVRRPTPLPPTPPTPPAPTPPKPSSPSTRQPVTSKRQDLLPAIQTILQRYRMNRKHAIIALRTLAARTRFDDVRKQAIEVAEELCGPLVLELRQGLEQAQKPADYQQLLNELNETAKYAADTKYETEVAKIKATVLDRLTTAIGEAESEVRKLVKEKKFQKARQVLSTLYGVRQAATLVRGLENLIKAKEVEARQAQIEQKRKKQEGLREGLREALKALDAARLSSLLTSADLLEQEEINFYTGMSRAVELIRSALIEALKKYVGKRLRISLRDGSRVEGPLNKVTENGLVLEGTTYKWAQIPIWQMAKFILTGKPPPQLVGASLSMMCFFKEPAEKVAELWEQAEKMGIDLPWTLKEYLASAVLSAGIRPIEMLMRRNRYIEAGQKLSLLIERFKTTRAYADHSEKLNQMMEECLSKSGLKAAFAGEVSFSAGRVRVHYDFSDPAQFHDFAFYPQTKAEKKKPRCEWRIDSGALYGSGNGYLRWLCPTYGDIKVRLIATPLTRTKTISLRLCDSGRGLRGQFISIVVSIPIYKEQIVGVRNGKPIKEWKYLHDEHRLGYKKRTKGAILQRAKQPLLKEGEPVTIEVTKQQDLVTMKIENYTLQAEIKGFSKGYLVFRVRESSVKFKNLTIYCNPDPSWVRSRSR